MGAFSIGLTSSADSGSWDATRAGTVPIVGRGPKHHNITMFSFHWSNRFACTDLERITRAELPVWGVASTCLSKGMSRHLVRVEKRDALFVASRRFLFPITSLTSRLELASHYSREHEHIWRGGCKDIVFTACFRVITDMKQIGLTGILLCWSEEATSVQYSTGAVRNSAPKGTGITKGAKNYIRSDTFFQEKRDKSYVGSCRSRNVAVARPKPVKESIICLQFP